MCPALISATTCSRVSLSPVLLVSHSSHAPGQGGTDTSNTIGMCAMRWAERLNWQRVAGMQVEGRRDVGYGEHFPPAQAPCTCPLESSRNGLQEMAIVPQSMQAMCCAMQLLWTFHCSREKAGQNVSFSWAFPSGDEAP